MVAFFDDRLNVRGKNQTQAKGDNPESTTLNEVSMTNSPSTSKTTKDAVEFIRQHLWEEDGVPLEEKRHALRQRFGDDPIPTEVVDALVNDSSRPDYYGAVVLYTLTKITKGKELLPFIENMLSSENNCVSGHAAQALLHIDEARGIREIETLFERFMWGPQSGTGFAATWFLMELREEVGSEACIRAAERLLARGQEIVRIRKALNNLYD